MIRPNIENIVSDLYSDASVPGHALRAVDTLVRYVLHLEHQLEDRCVFDPRNVPEFLDAVRKQHDKN